jgi:hypothetical protein
LHDDITVSVVIFGTDGSRFPSKESPCMPNL